VSIVSFKEKVSCKITPEPAESEYAGLFPELRKRAKPKLAVKRPNEAYPDHWLPDVAARKQRATTSRVSR
jgi:hypothetical protein